MPKERPHVTKGQAIAFKPDYLDARVRLGIALEKKGDLDGGEAEVRDVLRLKPDSESAHSTLCGLLIDRGKSEQRISYCREAIRLDPDSAASHFVLAVALEQKGDFKAALTEYRAVDTLATTLPTLRDAARKKSEELSAKLTP